MDVNCDILGPKIDGELIFPQPKNWGVPTHLRENNKLCGLFLRTMPSRLVYEL